MLSVRIENYLWHKCTDFCSSKTSKALLIKFIQLVLRENGNFFLVYLWINALNELPPVNTRAVPVFFDYDFALLIISSEAEVFVQYSKESLHLISLLNKRYGNTRYFSMTQFIKVQKIFARSYSPFICNATKTSLQSRYRFQALHLFWNFRSICCDSTTHTNKWLGHPI